MPAPSLTRAHLSVVLGDGNSFAILLEIVLSLAAKHICLRHLKGDHQLLELLGVVFWDIQQGLETPGNSLQQTNRQTETTTQDCGWEEKQYSYSKL